jgi:transcription elongation factor Elf1
LLATDFEKRFEQMSKKRRRLEIKVDPLPRPFMDETASCPVCGKDAAAIGRRQLQIVFRCEPCKVVFKRNRSWPYIY